VAKSDLTIPISNKTYQLNYTRSRVREIAQNDTFRKYCSLAKHATLTVIFTP